ncbi:MAG: spinster family MFS transporter [Hyphomonadaceae bacterium]
MAIERADEQAPTASGATPPKVYGKGYMTWTLFLLSIMYANNYADRTVLAVLAQPIKNELNITDTQLGLLSGLAFAAFYALFGYPIARLSDRLGRVNIITICCLLWSAMTALCGTAAAYTQLLIYRFGVGIGESGYAAPGHALISDYFPPRTRTTALAVFSAGVPIGALLGSIIGGWLAHHFGWREAFLFVSIPGFILAPILRLTIKEPPRGNWDASRLAGKPLAKTPPLWVVVKAQFSIPTFRHAWAGTIASGFFGSGSAFLGAYYVRRFDIDLTTVGLVLGILSGVAALIGTFLGGFLTDQFAKVSKRWYALLPAIALSLAGPIHVFGYTQSDWKMQVAIMLISGSLSSLATVPFYGLTQNLLPSHMRASGAAVIFFFINLISLGFGPVFNGMVIDWMTQHFFASYQMGEYFAVCGKGAKHVADATIAAACHTALAEGTRWTLAGAIIGLWWGAVHYLIASRTVARDLTEAEQNN